MSHSPVIQDYLQWKKAAEEKAAVTGPVKGWINRSLDDGHSTKFSKSALASFGGHEWTYIKPLVAELAERGVLKILKPIDEAADDEDVIEMLDYIDAASNRLDLPAKRA